MIIIAVVALIFIGPDQIPEVARTVGKLINDLKRSTDDIKRDLHQQTGLPKNFDEWLETRKEDKVHAIESNGHGDSDTPIGEIDSENQIAMNLDVKDSKDPNKS